MRNRTSTGLKAGSSAASFWRLSRNGAAPASLSIAASPCDRVIISAVVPLRSLRLTKVSGCKVLIATRNPESDDINRPSVYEFKAPEAKGRNLATLKLPCKLNRQLLECHEAVHHHRIEYVSKALHWKIDRYLPRGRSLTGGKSTDRFADENRPWLQVRREFGICDRRAGTGMNFDRQ